MIRDPLANMISSSTELAEEAKRLYNLNEEQTKELAAHLRLTAISVACEMKAEEISNEIAKGED